jgi:hypothetical protein
MARNVLSFNLFNADVSHIAWRDLLFRKGNFKSEGGDRVFPRGQQHNSRHNDHDFRIRGDELDLWGSGTPSDNSPDKTLFCLFVFDCAAFVFASSPVGLIKAAEFLIASVVSTKFFFSSML